MFRQIIKKLLAMIPILLVVSIILFFLMDVLPGDAAAGIANIDAGEAYYEQLREEMGLNRSPVARYLDWLGGLLHGNFGTSLITGTSVLDKIRVCLPVTLEITVLAMIVSILIALPCGIVSAIHRGTPLDTATSIISMLGVAMPPFWLGMLLILLFSVNLNWLPASGFSAISEGVGENLRRMVMPVGATGIILSEIEIVLRLSYSDMNLAQTLSDAASSEKVRERDLVSKLRYICYNSNYFEALLLMDEEGRSYVGATSLYETADSFCAGIRDEIEASHAAYTAWFQDEKGNVYVKKDVYSVTPLYRAGILIARLNSEKLLSLLGYGSVENARGVSAILYTDHLILSDKPMEPEVAREIAARCLAGQGDGFVTVQDRTFWLTVCGNQPWYVIRLLEKDEMLRAPDFVRNLSLVTVVICAAFSTLLSWILCDSMTRNIQRLNQGMDKVGEGDFSIRVQVHGKDEVSQLTRKFNLFVEHLGNTTQQMVRQATAKQQMELEMMDLRYRSLQTQISPHFICNILASVKGLNSLGRKDEVNRLLVLTSRYLRKNLNNSDIRFVAVRDEVAVVEEYLQIYEQVYRQPIVLNLSLPQELMDCSVPSLLLLPLVENSIQHGGFDRKEAAVIKLRVHREADRLILYLSDHGNGIPPQVLEGIRDAVASPTRSLPGFGIRSVLMRLRLLYGEEQQFVITSHEGHTTITISLPYRIYDGALPEAGSQ